MEVEWGPDFEKQRLRFGLKFTCDDCAHFDDKLGDCVHGFPNVFHRLDYYTGSEKPETILFCKDFDLA